MEIIELITKRNIVLFLIIIGTISLLFKLLTVDFSLPFRGDNMFYTLEALQYSQGDYFIPQKTNPGWPLFISSFLWLFNSDNFIDYSNLVRGLSLSVMSFTILPMYILARKFFDQKYSLVAVILFAFEPHLNYIAGRGVSEPLFILISVLAFLFILDKKPKFIFLSFILSGIFWWIRIEGFYLFIIISIIYLLNFRKSRNFIRNYGICIAIFLIVVSPMFLQRDMQYGDPFYIWYGENFFAEDYSELLTNTNDSSFFSYVEEYGIFSFIDKFVIKGISNLSNALASISYPYLFILLPFGILFSLRAFDQNKDYIRANWIFILTILATLLIPFSIITDQRFLFVLLPFLIIFAVLPIQRLIEYGLSTFSFSKKQKTISLLIILSIVVILSALFTTGVSKYGYGLIDSEKENEKIEYAKFLVNNLDGRMLDGGYVTEYVKTIKYTETAELFENYKSPRGKDPFPDTYTSGSLVMIREDGKTLEELISNGEKSGLKYIGISEYGSDMLLFLDDVYLHDENYPYLIKISDSVEEGYQKLKVKVFRIDYNIFHQNLD
ncbi:MAG: hypothetical protein HN773_04785 [Flavobacteriaceae bacterium]|nr:hypothetical protein [Flavobacteriaceae bacterium]